MSGEQLEAACERTHETAAPPRTNGDSARNTSTAPYKARAVCEPRAPPHPTRKRSKRSNGAPRNGKICAPGMIRGVRAAKAAPSWQDLRAVRSRKAVCRAFQMHGAHILPKPARFGCMARESCHEPAIFPSEAPFGIHEAQNLPRIAARERTRAKYCHCKALGNASEHNLAIARHPGTHQDEISPSPGTRERTVASRSRETPRERNIGQFNTACWHVQETMKIFWYLPPRNGAENVLA